MDRTEYNKQYRLKNKEKIKQKILKSYIDYYIKKETCDNVVEYLFY
jgi:hypothetical protein